MFWFLHNFFKTKWLNSIEKSKVQQGKRYLKHILNLPQLQKLNVQLIHVIWNLWKLDLFRVRDRVKKTWWERSFRNGKENFLDVTQLSLMSYYDQIALYYIFLLSQEKKLTHFLWFAATIRYSAKNLKNLSHVPLFKN